MSKNKPKPGKRPGQKALSGQKPQRGARERGAQQGPQHGPQHGSTRRTGHSGRRGDRNDGRLGRPEARTGREAGIKPLSSDGYFLFGRNSVEAALKNPARECMALYLTEKALKEPQIANNIQRVKAHVMDDVSTLSIMVPDGAPHQGVVMEVRPLRGQHLEDLAPEKDSKNIILMLDQVTDPHNVGACMRTAAAFGARALITQDRNSPLESGTLARSAAGGLEILPWIRVANLSDTLGKLRDMGYWHVGLDGGSGAVPIGQLSLGENLVIVMGSEGSGLRPLVKKNCDAIAKIPMPGGLESLNVSNAAAIALYELGGISE